MRATFSSLKNGQTFRLLDDRSAVVTAKLEKVGDGRAVVAGGVAWFDMHPASIVLVTEG
jgi:hypothetical protein